MLQNKIIIAVSGTPGTGKTMLSKMIVSMLRDVNIKAFRLDITDFAKKEKFYDYYDDESESYVVDENKLSDAFVKFVKDENSDVFVLDGHMSHLISKDIVDLVIVTLCNISVLKRRLSERGYGEGKIRENIDSEIMRICLNESYDEGHAVIEIDSTDKNSETYVLRSKEIYKRILGICKKNHLL